MRANLVALAALLVLLITIVGFGIAEYTRSDDRYSEQFVRSTEPRGEILKGPQGKITLYARQDSDSEAQRDIRFVDMQSGKVVALADDRDAKIYGAGSVATFGYVGLVKTGEQSGRPIFDFVFVRFSDMSRHVVASAIDALDAVTRLDDASFSAIVWDSAIKARFVIVDAKAAKIVTSRSLDFSDADAGRTGTGSAEQGAQQAAAAAQEAANAAAPINKFD
ncbi:hypothetical protein [Novosphingobium indicum]|uniref:hypothetical protein n=1 Tax=Novosphingobium indicum TaxID=462949 RepID=UPI00166781DB|nr:hypothetical protein [Novosphingobium indicum]